MTLSTFMGSRSLGLMQDCHRGRQVENLRILGIEIAWYFTQLKEPHRVTLY